jgi:hypothetical protein
MALPDEVVKESALCTSLSLQVNNLNSLNAECTASLQKMMEAVEAVESERQEMKMKLIVKAFAGRVFHHQLPHSFSSLY